MTLADHQESRLIADPFRLFDCCLESTGAAAVVVSGSDRAVDLKRQPIYISGVAEGHPDSPSTITQRTDVTKLGIAHAAPIALEMADVSLDEIDLAQIYDCFTYIVICQLEDLGFCEKGEGGPFVADGNIRLKWQFSGLKYFPVESNKTYYPLYDYWVPDFPTIAKPLIERFR